MKTRILFIATIAALSNLSTATPADDWKASPHSLDELRTDPVALIPRPRAIDWNPGQQLVLTTKLSISHGKGTESAAAELKRVLAGKGMHAVAAEPASNAIISFSLDPDSVPQPEGYHLEIENNSCTVTAHDSAGAFHAVQTIRQMLRADGKTVALPGCVITDNPSFPVRSFLHDTGRNFQTIDSLKSQIDRFAQYKLNSFHWHLTDNPAWRIECKSYPQLNDPRFRRPGRDPEATYSYDEIRDVIAYAKARHITIVPEIDMPGHSEFFTKAFGFAMGTPESLPILEKLIDEFCAEIPASDCPYLHLGADEVHIKNPEAFIMRMTGRVRANGRAPILWTPGLRPADKQTILQPWGDNAYKGDVESIANPILDSSAGYLNSSDPQWLPARYFFWQPCRVPEGSAKHLGGELCMWPDVRVDDKINIFRHSPVWPTLLPFSESLWLGRSHSDLSLLRRIPLRGTTAWNYLHEFESRMVDHRQRFFSDVPFPWIMQTAVQWQTVGPFSHAKGTPWQHAFAPESDPDASSYDAGGKLLSWQPVGGSTPDLSSVINAPVTSTSYLKTTYQVDDARTVYLRIGFEVPTRSLRRSSGIPQDGRWDANGGAVFINGKELPGPTWNQPGKFRFTTATWHKPPQEIPFTDEEFYWTREPVAVDFKKGDNSVLIRIPKTHELQPLQATCVPVKREGPRWIEDLSVTNQSPGS